MELIRHGGAAVLAETDELIGAESYILDKVRDWDTAQRFLDVVDRFKERCAVHGQSAEANPRCLRARRPHVSDSRATAVATTTAASTTSRSSRSARARRSTPTLRWTMCSTTGSACSPSLPKGCGPHTLAMGGGSGGCSRGRTQDCATRGYYFMDSPGNDLESIAGQVASGCNFIFFITGNGSITNFPFVPTIKIMTTTGRFELLRKDMDIDAGRYQVGHPLRCNADDAPRAVIAAKRRALWQTGTPMAELGMELFNMLIDSASGPHARARAATVAADACGASQAQRPRANAPATRRCPCGATGPLTAEPPRRAI
jgi:hypothetical protein